MTIIDFVCRRDAFNLSRLLERGCDPNFTEDSGGVTGLHYAAEKNDFKTAALLINAGANIFETTLLDGLTPLETACLHKNWEVAELLASQHQYYYYLTHFFYHVIPWLDHGIQGSLNYSGYCDQVAV